MSIGDLAAGFGQGIDGGRIAFKVSCGGIRGTFKDELLGDLNELSRELFNGLDFRLESLVILSGGVHRELADQVLHHSLSGVEQASLGLPSAGLSEVEQSLQSRFDLLHVGDGSLFIRSR